MVFVDFDDTLCLHKSTINSRIIRQDDFYKHSIPNNTLIKILQEYKDKTGDSVILLTMASSFMLEHKKEWCNKHCNGLIDGFISLSVDCSKAEYINNFDGAIVFIDDSAKERSEVEKLNNTVVLSPQYIQERGKL